MSNAFKCDGCGAFFEIDGCYPDLRVFNKSEMLDLCPKCQFELERIIYHQRKNKEVKTDGDT